MSTATADKEKEQAEAAAKAKALADEAAKAKRERPKSPQELAAERTARLVAQVQPGMMVDWYESGTKEDQPRIALVIGKGDTTLTLIAYDKAATYAVYKRIDGCKWVNDPSLRPFEQGDQGAFDLAPFTKKMFDLFGYTY